MLPAIRLLFQPRKCLRWKQASPTLLQRNIDSLEAFHVISGSHDAPNNRRRLDLTISAKLQEGRFTAYQAREAWVALRRSHPAMASVIQGPRRIYRRMNQNEQDDWLNETFITIEGDRALTPELLHQFKATSRPTMFFLHHTCTLALRTPHFTMDGLGAFYLLSDFLSELGRTKAVERDVYLTERTSDLAPCLEEATQSTFPSIRQLLRLWKIRRDWLRSYPSIGIKPDRECSSLISSWKDLQFSMSETSSIIRRTKQSGLSLTHTVHAALIMGAREHGSYPDCSNYTNVIVMDMRGRAADTPTFRRNIASAHHAIWPYSLSVTGDLLSLAGKLKQIYVAAARDSDILSLAGPIFVEGMRMMPTSSHIFHSSPFISSIGKLDGVVAPRYGSMLVEDVSIMAETCHADMVVIIWSFKGKLTVRVNYNEGKYTTGNIDRYLQLTKKALMVGLGVTP
jgi:hypothetical protein